MYLKLAYFHTLMWFVQNWPYLQNAMNLGVQSYYDAAEFAHNKGVITPNVRRWITPAVKVAYDDEDKTDTQLDYYRMLHIMQGDPDRPLLHMNSATAKQANYTQVGEYSQFDRMLFEDHKLVTRYRGKQLVRLQLSSKPRTAWHRDSKSVAARIRTSLTIGRRFVDAFTELGVSSKVAYRLCRWAEDNPATVVNHLEVLASQLHELTLTADERLELGLEGKFDSVLYTLNPLRLLEILESTK